MSRWTRRRLLKQMGWIGLGMAAGACARALQLPTPASRVGEAYS